MGVAIVEEFAITRSDYEKDVMKTQRDVIEWAAGIDEHGEQGPDFAAQCEEAFRIVYGREPSADDHRAGLWSLICAPLNGEIAAFGGAR